MSNQSYRAGIPDVPESSRHTIDCGKDCKPLIVEHRINDWLPRDHLIIERHIAYVLEKIRSENYSAHELIPSVAKFKEAVENNAILRMGFTEMLDQVPTKPPYDLDPNKKPQIRDYDTLFTAFNYIISHAFPYHRGQVISVPINAILDWPMGTEAGLSTFLLPEVNQHFKAMFDDWAKFLQSPASLTYLTSEENGWFGPAALEKMPSFVELYDCDSSAPHYGFKSWDAFFTRQFREGIRPVKFPDPEYKDVITSACESSVYNTAFDVKERDNFWIKGQPYSLRDMLNNDPFTSQFVGGTIYQAFLSVWKYHRWVSPVSGTIVRVEKIQGAYYAESPTAGFRRPGGPDPNAPNDSQMYVTTTSTRSIIWIECDNPEIGLMGFMAVGMVEISTCDVDPAIVPGYKVSKGKELGTFRFGGSTYCMFFRKGVDVHFLHKNGTEVELNSSIATVGKGGSRA
ncbi:phosphatidylserine decarboxylase [Rhizoctonia solani 123E]|uniref:Phosphatidylserine decarboxylase n=1 Tax=Rhizoctonia solani 123E TaxID=1423351 RepID=A0A074RU24_9AGAM|nr:phosphatidylserine decarboxylase [Rhizoctonia solani 123E]